MSGLHPGRLDASRRRPNGMITIALAVVLCVVAMLALVVETGAAAREAETRAGDERARYLDRLVSAFTAWYRADALAVERMDSGAVTVDELFAQARIERRWGAQAAIGPPVRSGDMGFRQLALWLPVADPDPSAFDRTSGLFLPAPGTDYRVVDGRRIEAGLRAETLARMQRLARALEIRFHARSESDSDRRVDVDQFRPVDPGCSPLPDELPCIDDFVPADRIGLENILGLPRTQLLDAWGRALLLGPVDATARGGPPFRLLIRSQTPWDARLEVSAVQPIE